MLKKTQRSFENGYGITVYDEELLNKPCVLAIVPTRNLEKIYSLYNGYLNMVMYILQIRKEGTVDSDYDIRDIPFDILIRTEGEDIWSAILNNIPSNNFEEAKRVMRNLNIISYCEGNLDTGNILKKLYIRLMGIKKYSQEEARQILKQIFVLQIVDFYADDYNDDEVERNEIPYATVVTVHDIFDLVNADHYVRNEEENLFDENEFIHIDKKNGNDRYIICKSFGEGSLGQREDEQHNFEYDYAKAPIIGNVISLYLIKALRMSIEGTEINGNISLQNEIDAVTVKALEFIRSKGKKYNDFNTDDLQELNAFLMLGIQELFKKSIPVRILSPEEKLRLDKIDQEIRKSLDSISSDDTEDTKNTKY